MLPCVKGSSTSSAALMESVRNRTAPSAIINREVDTLGAVGSTVADRLFCACLRRLWARWSQCLPYFTDANRPRNRFSYPHLAGACLSGEPM